MAVKVAVYGTADMKQIDRARKQLNALESGVNKNAKGFTGAMGRMEQSMKKYDKQVRMVALAALVMLGKAAIKSGEEMQTSNARIENITKQMGLFGHEAGNVSARLIKLAEAQALATGIDTNAIKQTQAKLLTFKELAKTADEVGGMFDRANQSALDLAAAGFGEATQNATQLGKALQDPIKGITALARSGVTFTDAEKKKIKVLVESGKMLEAQDTLMRAIETQVGGTAIATANATDKMKVAWQQATASLGTMLLPAVESLSEILVESVKNFDESREATEKWAKTGERAYSAADELKAPLTAIAMANVYWTEKGKEAIRTGEEQMSIWRKMVTPLGALAYAQGKEAEETAHARQEVELLAGRMKGAKGPTRDLTNALGDNADAADETAGEMDKLTRSMEGTMVAADEMSGKLRTLTELGLDQAEAAIRVREAEKRVAETLKESGKGSDEYKSAVINLERAKLKSADATADLRASEKALGATEKELAADKSLLQHLEKIRAAAMLAAEALASAGRKALTLKHISGSKTTGMQLRGAGGIVDSPEMALIGERGAREYVITTEGAYRQRSLDLFERLGRDLGVTHNSTSNHNVTINVVANTAADVPAIRAAVADVLRTNVRNARLMGA
jgi:hypothetical protein